MSFENESPRVIRVGHGYEKNPWEKPEELIHDIEEGIPLIKQALQSDLKINLEEEAREIRFDCMYKVPAKRDARTVIENSEKVPGFGQHLSGHRSQEGIKLYPTMLQVGVEASLSPVGLVEITVTAMGSDAYDVRFEYGLRDMLDFSSYLVKDSAKSAALIAALEQGAT
jgi:hypothetical protein